MSNLRVDPNGLSTFAGTVTELADVLRTASSTGPSGPAFQATSIAVTQSDGRVGAASLSMGDRIDDLSVKLRAAADAYRVEDDGWSLELAQTVGGDAR